MPDQQIPVTFQPQGRMAHVLSGTKVLEAAARAGMTIETPCGGAGVCGKCRVRIASGACPPGEADRKAFTADQLRDGWRLACQTSICEPSVIHIPQESLFADQHQILTESHTGAAQEVLPAVRKVYVQLPPPTLEENEADLLRLERRLGPLKASLNLLRQLPGLLRRNGFAGTAVITDHHLIDFEPLDTTSQCYGAAFDIGTTTLVGCLLDLTRGEELAVASAVNPQVRMGDDVVSRIRHACGSPGGLAQLQEAIVGAVGAMLATMCEEAHVNRRCVYELSFAGNTTMQHLLCGIDPSPLGQVPFAPAHARGLIVPAEQLGLAVHPAAAGYVFPVIGGFVGGDSVAGMLATRLAEQDGPVLMVDIGTNGEILLCNGGELWAASTAAGPAFEGARISCGMRAASGAIEKVVFDGDLRLGVIGDVAPVGICGSGLIDLAAELLGKGVVTPEGRLLAPNETDSSLAPALRRRMQVDSDGQGRFVLVEGDGRRPAVQITQRDVRELQLATGAIRAGIAILLKRAGLAARDLQRVLLAGGFGSFIRRSNAQRIGLLPGEIDHSRIHYVGNASLAGARWALLSTGARERAEELARRTRHVELATDNEFQAQFVEAMIFPSP
jgi:uncharacterized 2Fe-2S/4Fe-4S cluster protein (DUF4445 family)